jgi:hypothetical protein
MTEEAAPLPPRKNVFSLLWGIVRRPRSTLAYIRDARERSWILIALLAILTAVLLIVSVAPISARVSREAMQATFEAQSNAATQPLDPEAQQRITQFASNPLFTVVVPSVTTLIGLFIGCLLWTGALHLLSVMVGGDSQFGSMWRTVVWSSLPLILRNILQIGFVLVTGTVIANQGLSGLITQERSVSELIAAPPGAGFLALQTLLAQIDIFNIWNIALLVVAVMVTARVSTRKAILITLSIWALFLLARMALAIVPTLIASGLA